VIETSHVTKNPQRECITLDRTPNRRTNLTPDWIWVNLQLTIEAEGPRVLEA